MTRTGYRDKLIAMAMCFVVISTAFIFRAPVALAQATTGSIRGTVSDQAGGVIGGAIVTAKNEATGVQSAQFKTTGEGLYSIPSLIPGKYTVAVENQNFKRAVFTGVDVRLGLDTVIDAVLQPGGA